MYFKIGKPKYKVQKIKCTNVLSTKIVFKRIEKRKSKPTAKIHI